MDPTALHELLDGVRSGAVTPDEAVATLRRLPYADLGFARVDHHRRLRQGLVEAVYAPGKRPEHAAAIVGELLAGGSGPVVMTRADAEQVALALATHPGGEQFGSPAGATVVWRPAEPDPAVRVALVVAGTADLPVADECRATLEAYGVVPVVLVDVGVAGLHRLLASADVLSRADAVVVVAGMEGALASVVGGITGAPVVAVPTSVGYGSSLAGVTALLGMLASCAAGLTVVGIDNGFGAASSVLRVLGAADRARARLDPGTGDRDGHDVAVVGD